jgi:hypothetical protein
VEEDEPKFEVPGIVGQELRLPIVGARASSPLEIVGPLEHPEQESLRVWATEGRLAWTFDRAGFYEVRQDGQPHRYLAVNAAAPGKSGQALGAPRLQPSSGPKSGPTAWHVLAMVAAVLVLVEYYSFHRKWTV